MRRMVDISELLYYAYVAHEHNFDLEQFMNFLAAFPDEETEHVVNCIDCNNYDIKKRGFCKYWGSYGHLPDGYCEQGDDSDLNYS